MSEKARELANKLFRNDVDEESEIDQAVAPLVEALEIAGTYVELVYDEEGGEEAVSAKQDLNTVREALKGWKE